MMFLVLEMLGMTKLQGQDGVSLLKFYIENACSPLAVELTSRVLPSWYARTNIQNLRG